MKVRHLPSLLLIVAISGACSLVYQVVWFRLIRHVFGSSTAATGVVVALFMGGLGLGGAYFGRRVVSFKNPLGSYAILEGAIALSAALTPLLVDLGRGVYYWLGGSSSLGPPGALAARLVLTFVVLGVPTFLMGGTLPLVAQAVAAASDPARRRVAWLYGANTLGAVFGTWLATFVALEMLGLRRTLWLATASNLLLAMFVRRLAFSSPEATERQPASPALQQARADGPSDPRGVEVTVGPSPHPGDSGEEPARATSGAAVPAGRPDPLVDRRGPSSGPATGLSFERPLVLFAAFVFGFVFFLMELVWYRMLAPILGGSTYTFGLILATALAGIGAGGLLYALGAPRIRPRFPALALSCLLQAVALLAPYAAGDSIALLAATLQNLAAAGFAALVLGWLVVTTLVVFPAALVAGYQFPLLVGLLGGSPRRVGRDLGLAYALNTFGAVLGALGGGFGLLPALGAPGLWLGCSLVLGVLGIVLAVVGRRRATRGFSTTILATAALVLVLLSAEGPTAFWRHNGIGAGRLGSVPEDPKEFAEGRWDRNRHIRLEVEGIESSIAVYSCLEPSLLVNGKSDGSVRGDQDTTIMSGILPAIFHPDPRNALVIGWGTGTTAGWLAAVDSIETVDVVEIEPAVMAVAPHLDALARGALDSAKVRVQIGDGREVLLSSGVRYDIVFSEPSNPYRAGVSDLFSRDFYEGVRSRGLSSDGIFVQWLQAYELDAEVFGIVLATLDSVFPSVEVWRVGSFDFALLASQEPLDHDAQRLRQRVAQELYREALRRTWGVEGLEGLYSGYVAGPLLARTFPDRVSTDDRPIVEYGFVRNLGSRGRFSESDLHNLSVQLKASLPPSIDSLDLGTLVEARSVRWIEAGRADLLDSIPPLPDLDRRNRARIEWKMGNLGEAARLWADAEPRSPYDELLLGETRAEAGEIPDLASLRTWAPVEAALVEARAHWRRGDSESAHRFFREGYLGLRETVGVNEGIIERSFELAIESGKESTDAAERMHDLLAVPFVDGHYDRYRTAVLFDLRPFYRPDDSTRQLVSVESFEPHLPWDRDVLSVRLFVYDRFGHPRTGEAFRDLGRLEASAPPALPGSRRMESGPPSALSADSSSPPETGLR